MAAFLFQLKSSYERISATFVNESDRAVRIHERPKFQLTC